MFPYSAIPRPEYPRPERQRGRVEGKDWLNLNGPWQFRFDPHRSGVEHDWAALGGGDWREQIIVPFCWESLAAWGEGDAAGSDNYYSTRVFINPVEVTRENHRTAPRYEVGWYRRIIEIPNTRIWRNKRAILTIGAADFFTDCWCNGVHLGRNEGGYVPFEFDLTDTLSEAKDGESRTALIVIRVEDPMDNHEQPVGKQWGWYTPTSGIWQTVFIEPRSREHIESFRIVPDIDHSQVNFEVFCEGADGDCDVAIEIIPPEAPPHTLVLNAHGGTATGSTELHPLSLWDPGDPKLYPIILRLRHPDGHVLDEVRSYFGMRKISTAPATDVNAPAMLCLNNKPIYLRGALYQSYHCDGVYTARDASTLRSDIAYARKVGFDFLRIHIKLDDPLVLYYADTLGILLMQDFPNFGEGGDTPTGRRRFEEMMRLGFKRDFNHPSIIAWCIFNETWGFGGQTELMKVIKPNMSATSVKTEIEKLANTSSFKWVHEMWTLAKSFDSTRLIEDMSVVVWEHLAAYGHVDTDINSWHFYIDDYARARAHIENVVAKTYRGSNFNYIEGFTQSGAPLINSEYGGIGALDGDVDISWSFKFLTNELRRHGQLSAYIYTELTDVEWEYNGFLNYDRTPKEFGYLPNIVNQGDVLPIDAPPISRVPTGGTVEVDVLSSHFSRRRHEAVTFQWVYSGIDTLGRVYSELARGSAKIPFTHHRVELAKHLTLPTPIEPMLCTLSVAAITPDGQTIAGNFIQHMVGDESLPSRDNRGNSLVLRKPIQAWHAAEWSGGASTREGAQKLGRCFGEGAGYFEWRFEDDALLRIGHAHRLRLLCEVSACREDTPQTGSLRFPTQFELFVNDLPVHRALLPDHPHDTRGALSYLKGGRGGYGYLMRASIEDGVLQRVAELVAQEGALRLRCSVPANLTPHGGLTVYDHDCGRFPLGPTVVIDWEQAEAIAA